MGSPHMIVERVILEDWPYHLAEWKYQDKFAYDSKRKFAVLIKWDISEDNEPGFRPVLLIEKTKANFELDRIEGCCNGLSIKKDRIIFEVFKNSILENFQVKFPHHISI